MAGWLRSVSIMSMSIACWATLHPRLDCRRLTTVGDARHRSMAGQDIEAMLLQVKVQEVALRLGVGAP